MAALKVERSLSSDAQAAVYQQASDLRACIVEYPEARRFLFGDEPVALPEHHPKGAEITTLAEMFLNYLEQLAVQHNNLGRRNWKSWETFVRDSVKKSPLLSKLYSENAASYSDDFKNVVGPPAGDSPF